MSAEEGYSKIYEIQPGSSCFPGTSKSVASALIGFVIAGMLGRE